MKKKILIILFLLFISACSNNENMKNKDNLGLNKVNYFEENISKINEEINDLDFFNSDIFALTNKQLYKIKQEDISKVEVIKLKDVKNPQGICKDNDGNIYVVDTGNNKIIQLLKSTNYKINNSFTFGDKGVGDGQFNSPEDCMIDPFKDDQKIYIVDTGNNRIQIFDFKGIYISQFDGSNTKIGKFKNPKSIISRGSVPIILDTGNNLIRVFNSDGSERRSMGKNILNHPDKITNNNKGNFLVTDKKNNKVLFLSSYDAKLYKSYSVGNNPKVALNFDVESDITLVGFENKKEIKKYEFEKYNTEKLIKQTAKDFIDALITGDKANVRKLVVRQSIYDKLYADEKKLNTFVIPKIKQITSYKIERKFSVSAIVSGILDNGEKIKIILIESRDNKWLIQGM